MGSNSDPWTQIVTMKYGDGRPLQVPMAEIDELVQYSIRICINYAAQLGASIMLLIILLILTRPEKRGSYVFCLNCLALVFNVGRLVCQILFFTSPFMRAYAVFAGDYSRVPTSAYVDSVLAVVFAAMLLICIEISLVLQVQVVCSNLARKYRRPLLGVSIFVALIPITFRLWYLVVNCKSIVGVEAPDSSFHWLQSTDNIVLTVSICFFCAIFTTKLGLAIRMRRRLGLNDFGPMKAIFIMGCQTLVIPAIFSIAHHASTVPELSSNVLTLVTISLPLSSIWAGTTLDNSRRQTSSSSGRKFWQVFSIPGMNRSRQPLTSTSSSSSTTAQIMKPSVKCYSETTTTASPSAEEKRHTLGHSSPSPFGIAVEHDITVQSSRRDSFGDV